MNSDSITFWPTVGMTETLYSVCSALRHLRGGVSNEHHSLLLFDESNAGWLRQVPANLDYFCRVTYGQLGTPKEILADRTTFGFHMRFLKPSVANDFLVKACAPRTSGFKFPSPETRKLRLCVECVLEDREELGRASWRLEHQLPGAKVCMTHGHWLEEIAEINREGSRSWLRADQFVDREPAIPARQYTTEWADWQNLADILWVLKSHERVFPPLLHQVLAEHLASTRAISAPRFLNSKTAADCLKRNAPAYLNDELEPLQGDWLRFLDGRGAHHPLRWAALFASCMSGTRLNLKLGRAYPCQATLDGRWEVASRGNEDLLPKQVWDSLLAGADVTAVSRDTNRSAGAINRALRLNPELKAIRDAKILADILLPKRNWVCNFLRQQPGAKRKDLHRADSASLRWLDLNDREWLWQQVPPTKAGRWPQKPLFPASQLTFVSNQFNNFV